MAYKGKTFELMDLVKDKHGDDYLIIGEYTGHDKKIELEHASCGYRWEMLPSNIRSKLTGTCPECSGKRHRSPEEYKQIVHDATNGDFTVLGEYKGIKYSAMVRHNVCGYEWETTFEVLRDGMKIGSGCPQCANRAVVTTEVFRDALKNMYGDEYKLVGECEHSRTLTEVFHNECGKTFSITPTQMMNSDMICTHCSEEFISNGERKIRTFLENGEYNFKREASFEGCRNIYRLPFDFAVLNNSNDVKMLIEFDGKQHYEPIDFFGGKDTFKEQVFRDKIKNDYCKDRGIPLLRIPYWEYENINKILHRELRGVV